MTPPERPAWALSAPPPRWRFNMHHYPAHAPDGHGGEFAPKANAALKALIEKGALHVAHVAKSQDGPRTHDHMVAISKTEFPILGDDHPAHDHIAADALQALAANTTPDTSPPLEPDTPDDLLGLSPTGDSYVADPAPKMKAFPATKTTFGPPPTPTANQYLPVDPKHHTPHPKPELTPEAFKEFMGDL